MDFSDIGSYSDDDVAIQLDKLRLNNEFHDYISSLIFPKTNKYFSKLQRIYVRREFSRIFSQCNSINQFQDSMAPLMKRMIEKTTDGFTYSGQENLTDQPTLFIGNHRDISLDPAFLNYLLHLKELNTVRIAIGDNLLDGGYAEIIMRLNKSFVVHREIKGVKETLRKLSKLSAYINQSLWLDKESIWIAQKQGRANDGNDFSDEGVLKMLFLNEKKSKSINEWRKAVNLTPIGAHQNVIVKRIDEEKVYLQAHGGMPINCFYHIYGTRSDGERLIPEYEGKSPADYPGNNDEYSVSGYHYDKRGE